MKRLFTCDWDRVLMIHYEVKPAALQAAVPYALDLYKGSAYVSLVAFTLKDMRFSIGGPLTAWMTRPIATHAYMNVRTYVKNDDKPGIYFITEWLSSRLATALGPLTFGLPYRLGRLDYRHDHERGQLSGTISTKRGSAALSYTAAISSHPSYCSPERDTLTEFLMERYIAYTSRGRAKRRFHVWHEPWQQVSADATVDDRGLLACSGAWHAFARIAGANYCPGLRDVGMGRPIMCS